MNPPLGTSSADWLTAIATAVGALGTLAAVVVALYLSAWRDVRRRPKLSLEIGRPSDLGGIRRRPYDVSTWGETESLYFVVANERGRRTAHDVEVLLTARLRSDEPDKGPYTQFYSRPLAWAFATAETGGPVTQVTIPPGVRRRVEVMRVGPPDLVWAFVAGPERSRETLDTATHIPSHPWAVGVFTVPPVTLASVEYARKEWTYELEFVVSARDLDAEAYTTTLTFDVTGGAEGFSVLTNWTPLRKVAIDRAASQESGTRESGV